MKGLTKNYPILSSISLKLRRIRQSSVSGIRETINERKTIGKVRKKLDDWIQEGKHHDTYESMDMLLDELEITSEELSFYCSKVLKKKFVSWRKELRINEAKELLLLHPETPVCHIGYAVGLYDKSNFRQQFRSVVGCTPTEWREMNLKEYVNSDR
ncbi:MAG TPA: hypothetical protein DIT75_02310 [Rikenellaceae bacterium]|nr:hypothetical protein [Rikenellaceae bacterium]